MSDIRDTFHLFAIEPWMKRGRCTDLWEDPEDWFPTHSSGTTERSTRHAIEVCGACPVRTECLEFAITANLWPRPLAGIWGGTTESARKPAVRAYRATHKVSQTY